VMIFAFEMMLILFYEIDEDGDEPMPTNLRFGSSIQAKTLRALICHG